MIRSGIVSAVNALSEVGLSVNEPIVPVPVRQTIQVQLDPLTGCGACSASGGCGVQILPVAQAAFFVDCQVPEDAAVFVGDRVQIELAEPGGGWLTLIAQAYGGPTIGMIFGAVVGFYCAHALHVPQFSESFSLAGFVVGLTGGLIAWFRAEKSVQIRHAGEYQARFQKIIQER